MDPGSHLDETESTPLLVEHETDSGPVSRSKPIPRWVTILHWMTALDGVTVGALGIAIAIANEFFRPGMYNLPWRIKQHLPAVVVAVRHSSPFFPLAGWVGLKQAN